MAPLYFVGLDLGQAHDFTALAVLEQTLAADPNVKRGSATRQYACRHLERFKLGTPYPVMVERIAKLVGTAPLRGCTLVVDQTGVGRPVVDLLKAARLPVRLFQPITITGGHAVKMGDDGSQHVPKKELVSTLQVLLQTRRLKIAQELPEVRTLEQELLNFRVKITIAANEMFGEWREGQHDDLVLAVALAVWQAEHEPLPSRPLCMSRGVDFPRPY